MFEKRLIVWLLLLSFLPGCSTTLRAQPLAVEEPSTEAPETAPLATNPSDFWATDLGAGTAQRGKASWYGKRFHGRRTASGEVFKMSELTAAHRTLPLLSYAKVTLLSNGKSVIVRINDRGPHILTHRIIDLSQAAAAELGLLSMGTGDVLVERVVARDVGDPPSLSKK
ncbi:rare lipoprotein A [Rhodoferax sp. OV413]|uniref:septal ring lytic transglycosylase RlpA family protein n=1 Tax=Rhodoferax sp. OV413 TaxID=1855285 RepID=UPI00088F22D0|nr:septal ring lytic transglycosylase RlpA family protein [Rhodoferax sp. OV413]SDP57802.1 rare lipoprotein A [Rhodoferax sp. OV413]